MNTSTARHRSGMFSSGERGAEKIRLDRARNAENWRNFVDNSFKPDRRKRLTKLLLPTPAAHLLQSNCKQSGFNDSARRM